MAIAGYFASALIGISLGIIGGGGSILTVPVLVYLFSSDPDIATVYSLFIVGATSTVGSVSYFKKGLVNTRIALVFGIPSVIAVFISRTYIVPAIPQQLFHIGQFPVTRDMLLLSLFAVLMIAAAYSMIMKSRRQADAATGHYSHNYLLILVQSIVLGLVTGLLGAGGGFLIIPVLVNGLRLPIRQAIGTSLVIIGLNSLVGFSFSLHHYSIQWFFLASITAITTVGIISGSRLSSRIDPRKLKPAFGWFILVMGLYILVKEISNIM